MKMRWMLMTLTLAGLAVPALAVDEDTAEKVAERREKMERDREDREDRDERADRDRREDGHGRPEGPGRPDRRSWDDEEEEYGGGRFGPAGRPGAGRPAAREDRPWMGVVVAPVPAPLRAHLRLEGKGVMVLNIVKDSPADRAGLARYDVLVDFDGKMIGDEPGDLLERIAGAKVDQAVKLSVIRGGKLEHKPLTLAKPVPRQQARMKYDADPEQEWAGQRRWRPVPREGGIGWVLPDGRRIRPEDIDVELNGKKLGDLGRVRVEVRRGPDGVRVRRVGQGKDLSVRRKGEAFTVTRPDESGKETEKTYDSAEALRKGDPDAWGLWQRYSQQAARPGSAGQVSLDKLLEGEDGERLRRQLGEMMERMERTEREARRFGDDERLGRPGREGIPPMPESMDEHFRRLQEQVEQLRRHALEQMESHRRRPGGRPTHYEEDAEADEGRPSGRTGDRGPTRQEFHVEPDGKITVSVSRGPQSFMRTFKNEQAFKQAAPKLYEQYRKLKGELE